MKKRQTTETLGFSAFLQVMVVGVLLFAVIWQLNGTIQREPDAIDPVDAPVTLEEEPTARPFLTTDEVNLRRGPGTDHEVITVAPMHAELLVTGEGQNGFVPVTIDGISAWASESYLAPEGTVLGGTSTDLPVAQTIVEPPAALAGEPVAEQPLVEEGTAAPPDAPVDEVAQVPVEMEPHDPVEEPPPALAAQTYTEPVEETVIEEPGERWVEVDRSTAIVTLHEGDRIVAQFEGLIGKDPSPDGYYSTAVGTFHVHTMTRELAETPFAPGVYLTHFVGFDPARSNGFHSPTRDADGNIVQTGGTTTLGCVRLGEAEAIQMFEFAYIGMRVEIHD